MRAGGSFHVGFCDLRLSFYKIHTDLCLQAHHHHRRRRHPISHHQCDPHDHGRRPCEPALPLTWDYPQEEDFVSFDQVSIKYTDLCFQSRHHHFKI